MIGGGALFWTVAARFTKRLIADVNPDLINLYVIIRDEPLDLIKELKKPKYHYIHKTDPESLAAYKTIRASDPEDSITKAARILFLMRVCFNGLMRVNKQGRFNVPPGSYRNPQICNEPLILADSQYLQNTEIRLASVVDILKSLPRDYLVFLDPPYFGDKKFTDYSGAFTAMNQTELISAVLNGGWSFIYTNRACPLILEQFSAKGVNLEVVPLKHSVQPKYTTGITEKELIAWREKPKSVNPNGARLSKGCSMAS